ncbi:MAG: hypothetical protein ACRD4M_10075, partial [Candidatus Acidiferrales bacterium]
GHPQWDFPPTSPNFLTVYMDDDELCRYKRYWPRVNYRVELKPSEQTLREAEARQKIRFGEDYVQHKRYCSFSWR